MKAANEKVVEGVTKTCRLNFAIAVNFTLFQCETQQYTLASLRTGQTYLN